MLVEQFDVNGLRVKIGYDEDAESPRAWDNLGTMVCWHRRYNLGDQHEYRYPEDFFRALLGDAAVDRIERDNGPATVMDALVKRVAEQAVILPLYLYDHSGLTMNTTGFHCPWDSGQVGWIYVSLEDVRREYGVRRVTRKLRAAVEKHLRAEVETYDQYLRGEVYEYAVETADGDYVDSLCGLYGLDYARQEARAAAENAV